MARAGDELVNQITGLRTIFRKTAEETNGELLQVDWIGDPTWSPDRTKIAFHSNRISPDGTSDYDIWRVRAADGANPTNLTNAPGNDTNPAWQPLP
jgi:Tol biopolymer transport system component